MSASPPPQTGNERPPGRKGVTGMGIFSMGGAQITGPLAFREHFDALDFLSQLELAAGFAVLQLGCLSALDKYNSEVLYQSVFLGRECLDSPLSRPQDYLELDMFLDARE